MRISEMIILGLSNHALCICYCYTGASILNLLGITDASFLIGLLKASGVIQVIVGLIIASGLMEIMTLCCKGIQKLRNLKKKVDMSW
ncbi:hypothetical protein YK48G_18490 [Lentilactobacillus fungorum]|uniref:Uncharacterized protein n=1 Tax=Lentilactobacillus fungorum TaxID=2201250 RepID=A0ABQ3W4K3_9LACO|nr:hypothetical protein YK48G_18490 [Lentilactobacillus fungorum]